MRGARRGSAERRWRRAISTSPSQDSDRAAMRGAAATETIAREAEEDGLEDFVGFGGGAAGLGLGFCDGFSGESFRILRGRKGILDGGDELCDGALLSSVGDVLVGAIVVAEIELTVGEGRGWSLDSGWFIRVWVCVWLCSPISN